MANALSQAPEDTGYRTATPQVAWLKHGGTQFLKVEGGTTLLSDISYVNSPRIPMKISKLGRPQAIVSRWISADVLHVGAVFRLSLSHLAVELLQDIKRLFPLAAIRD
jgi:hypothetical protein